MYRIVPYRIVRRWFCLSNSTSARQTDHRGFSASVSPRRLQITAAGRNPADLLTHRLISQLHRSIDKHLEKRMHEYIASFNPLTGTCNYSATSNNMKLVHWRWRLMGGLLHLVQQGRTWACCGLTQSPPRCTKCNSPPINRQCTNYRIAV